VTQDGHPSSRATRPYLAIVQACEAFLERHGDSYLGVGWTKSQAHADTRYRVMLEVMRGEPGGATLLDFGCGLAHLYEHMQRFGPRDVEYHGLDLSERFLAAARGKHPDLPFHLVDVLREPTALPEFDYVVMNGVFTMRAGLSKEQMFDYFRDTVSTMWPRVRVGMAFNVMSTEVDWERDDLFHLPFDVLGRFLAQEVSRHFVMRHDYGLYEYTTYVYRRP
jgi:SAM-dependent methyltransferase